MRKVWQWFVAKLAPHISAEVNKQVGWRMGTTMSDAEVAALFEQPLDTADKEVHAIIVSTMIRNYATQHLEASLPNLVERFVEECLAHKPLELIFTDNALRIRLTGVMRGSGWQQELIVERLGELNKRCETIIAAHRDAWLAEVPERVIGRLSAAPMFRMGWTGWKPNKQFTEFGSQFLACIIPFGDGKGFHGGRVYLDRLQGQHFPELFGVDVLDSGTPVVAAEYHIGANIGPALPMSSLSTALAVSEQELTVWLHTSFVTLQAALIARVDEAQAKLDSPDYKPVVE